MTSEVELSPLESAPVFEDLPLDQLPLDAESLAAVQDVPVKVRAVIGRARMPIGDLVRLVPGSVVELDRRVGEPVDILINDRLVARGEIVLIDQALGVTLTEIVRTEQ
jgi:flagellar motor switch protein FliN/FliY